MAALPGGTRSPLGRGEVATSLAAPMDPRRRGPVAFRRRRVKRSAGFGGLQFPFKGSHRHRLLLEFLDFELQGLVGGHDWIWTSLDFIQRELGKAAALVRLGFFIGAEHADKRAVEEVPALVEADADVGGVGRLVAGQTSPSPSGSRPENLWSHRLGGERSIAAPPSGWQSSCTSFQARLRRLKRRPSRRGPGAGRVGEKTQTLRAQTGTDRHGRAFHMRPGLPPSSLAHHPASPVGATYQLPGLDETSALPIPRRI